ncbi:MAG: hypothetical protein J5612_02750 [Paludibacteraceae bacterium]|nr:hypothetical protein [Paludibacteraceae bacterium]
MKKIILLPWLIVLNVIIVCADNTQLAQQIIEQNDAVDATLPQINILIKKGEKGQAKALIDKTLKQVEQIEVDRKRLTQMGEEDDAEVPSLAQLQETKRYLTNKANQLRYTAVYITCAANLFGEDYVSFCEEINGALTDFDVSFVDDEESAEWVVSVTAKAREHTKNEQNGTTTYYAYADAELEVVKTATGKRVCQKRLSEKGGHFRGYNQAAQEAYKYLVPKISAVIQEQMAQ